jgi:hypothetical protein
VVERPSDSTRVNDIKIVHTSILSVLDTTFTVRGYSKYLFDIKTMTSIGLDKLKVSLDC